MGQMKFNPQTGELQNTQYCIECGTELLQNANFCSNCGQKCNNSSPARTIEQNAKPSFEETVKWIQNTLKSNMEGMFFVHRDNEVRKTTHSNGKCNFDGNDLSIEYLDAYTVFTPNYQTLYHRISNVLIKLSIKDLSYANYKTWQEIDPLLSEFNNNNPLYNSLVLKSHMNKQNIYSQATVESYNAKTGNVSNYGGSPHFFNRIEIPFYDNKECDLLQRLVKAFNHLFYLANGNRKDPF